MLQLSEDNVSAKKLKRLHNRYKFIVEIPIPSVLHMISLVPC